LIKTTALKINREIQLGLLAVATIALFIWGFNYLKGRDILRKHQGFFVVYDQVTGLIESNPVSLNGVAIGQVRRISFHPDQSGRIVVECLISSQVNIPGNSVAHLASSGLIGGKEVIIRLGDAPTLLQDGDTLAGVYQPDLQDELIGQLMPVKEQAEALIARMDTVLKAVSEILDPEARGHIAHSLARLSATMDQLERSSRTLEGIMEQESGRLAGILEQAATITANLQMLSDTMAAHTIHQANASLESLNRTLQRIEGGEGSLGLLLADTALYRNLEASSRELELLLEDVRNNPKRYFSISVFGR
jgi:phospholipid/cholesterol/gamma-HCH transport system substrate-binding protein